MEHNSMVCDDGDIVRGLGFVSIYSAWIEEDVDDLLRLLAPVEPFDDKKQRWQINRKLDYVVKLVESLGSAELDQLPAALKAGRALFERRNEAIHGRIYAGHDKIDYLQSGRSNVATRPITSSELYQLANDFWNYRDNLIAPTFFRLPRAIQGLVNCAP
jgi:hypothetical protein